jgi:NAD(P)-dependent dehydrogenase (short-subunit alcohol dehydrogenase family)
MPVAIVTGASRGLGRALATELASAGWSLVVDARSEADLGDAARDLRALGARVEAIAGDVSSGDHRRRLVDGAAALGGLDLLVNNASTLGVSPLPRLLEHPLDQLRTVFEVNVLAPLALVALAAPLLRRSERPVVLQITSDASVEHYETWGGYGSSKAALDHMGATLAAEEIWLRVLTVDPGDMRTRMHQDAFPGEDISDRPLPGEVVPALLALLAGDQPSGRYRARQLLESPLPESPLPESPLPERSGVLR